MAVIVGKVLRQKRRKIESSRKDNGWGVGIVCGYMGLVNSSNCIYASGSRDFDIIIY